MKPTLIRQQSDLCMPLASYWFRSRRWRRYFPPKRPWTWPILRSLVTQNIRISHSLTIVYTRPYQPYFCTGIYIWIMHCLWFIPVRFSECVGKSDNYWVTGIHYYYYYYPCLAIIIKNSIGTLNIFSSCLLASYLQGVREPLVKNPTVGEWHTHTHGPI
jgi:hypothetical protein